MLVLLLFPCRDGKTRGVVEVDSLVIILPWDMGVPEHGSLSRKESQTLGGCWGHDSGHITSNVIWPDDPWLGSAGVDAAKGANWIFGVGRPIKCARYCKLM